MTATNYNFVIQIRETSNGGFSGQFGKQGNFTSFAVTSAADFDTYLASTPVTTYFTTQQIADIKTAFGIS